MITRFPVLEFLRGRTGTYVSADGEVRVVLANCGYGFAIEATGKTRRGHVSGVIGVAGANLELHALVGFPNVVCFVWPHEFRELSGLSEVTIELHSSELDASVILCFSSDLLRYGLVAGKQAKVFHELQRA